MHIFGTHMICVRNHTKIFVTLENTFSKMQFFVLTVKLIM